MRPESIKKRESQMLVTTGKQNRAQESFQDPCHGVPQLQPATKTDISFSNCIALLIPIMSFVSLE
jgi:hypothetical protein